MNFKAEINGADISVKENLFDIALRYFNPIKAQQRLESRLRSNAMMAISGGGYAGASRTRRTLSSWLPGTNDSDGDTLQDLPELRGRSRDSVRDNPIAGGLINTAVTGTVGTGAKLKSQLDRQVLGMSDDEADDWETNTEREWRLFWSDTHCDISRRMTGADLEELYFRSVLENGDTFVLMPMEKRIGSTYSMRVQLIEADRIVNKDNREDTVSTSGGIKRSPNGAPIEYHVLTTHPGNLHSGFKQEWTTVKAFGSKTGRQNVIHGYRHLRIGQNRGVPFLTTVIETLKQLSRFSEAYLMATVVSSMFTVFIKTKDGSGLRKAVPGSDFGENSTEDEMKLSPAGVISLGIDEDISTASPGLPSDAYGPFFISVLRQISSQTEIPLEILIKHFTASFSASRAALLEAFKFFVCRRQWIARTFLNVIYQNWMMEAVSIGRIKAPGFFSDAILRQAYLGREWIWMPMGQIDEIKQVRAARERVDAGFSTISRETIELNGGDWERNHPQSSKEMRARKESGLIVEAADQITPEPVSNED